MSTKNSTIANWASLVAPGSPAPISPQRRTSVSIAITSHTSPKSFLNIIDTPSTTQTPSINDFRHDLTTLGYTSLFVHLPTTPGPKSAYNYKTPLSPTTFANIPIPPIPASPTKQKPLKRFPSLSALRSATRRPRSKSLTATTTTTTTTMPMLSTPWSHSKPTTKSKPAPAPTAVAIANRKKAKYAPTPAAPRTNARTRMPPTLANELALMQFADGGNIESHVKRLMDAQARAAAGTGGGVGVGDVYRDGKGGIWWDQEEEWEYAHLLAGDKSPTPASSRPPTTTGMGDWVRFTRANDENAFDRRPSVSTTSSAMTDVEDEGDRRVVRPSDEEALRAFGSCVPPRALRAKRGAVAVQMPYHHQQQVGGGGREFLLAFVPRDDPAAHSPAHANAPANAKPNSGANRKEKPSRRRPAPLVLTHANTNTPTARAHVRRRSVDAERARRDFIAGSFVPAPAHAVPSVPVPPIPAMHPMPQQSTVRGGKDGKTRLRGMSLAGLFRRRE